MPLDLDPRFTFDTFVVGPANRLASAAARRVADAPGSTYTPLFLYSGSGLGKTHLLTAIGNHVRRVHDSAVRFESLEHLLEEISAAVEAGERDALRGRLRDVGVLLLDDVQFIEGQRQLQDELIRAWDAISAQGGQVVLTSDRPPQEIDGLDQRLLSRLSGGLIVDIAAPDYETRVAIARRKADERGQALSPEVFEVLARVAFTNVRELQGALNRLIAVQELERRTVTAEEVTRLLGVAAAARGRDEFGEFLSDITGTVSAVVVEGDRRIADAILEWEGEGYRTRRLEAALSGTTTAPQAEALIRRFGQDVERLRQIEGEIRALDPEARELTSGILQDPDRVVDAEGLLAGVRERLKPPPAPPAGARLDELEGDTLALRAAAAVVDAPGGAYNPLFVLGPAGSGKSALLTAVGNGIREARGVVVGYVGADTFAVELIEALEHSRLDAWRARYRRAEALLVDDLDRLPAGERAHEELFHLFEELHRSGRQLVFAAAVPPQDLPLPDRLRTRLESGLVVELEEGAPRTRAPARTESPARGESPARAEPPARADHPPSHGMLSREKVPWEWPYAGDWIEEALD